MVSILTALDVRHVKMTAHRLLLDWPPRVRRVLTFQGPNTSEFPSGKTLLDDWRNETFSADDPKFPRPQGAFCEMTTMGHHFPMIMSDY